MITASNAFQCVALTSVFPRASVNCAPVWAGFLPARRARLLVKACGSGLDGPQRKRPRIVPLSGFVPSGQGQCKEHLKMAYNKTKHLDAAQKYLQQGKLPQAIAEYQQILKNEPKDQVTLMTLGDLFVRQGETFQALEYFERLAKIFLNDGFTTKAIAIYKKVAKLAPEESRPLERLAELYVQQGVLSEARPIYLQLAEVHLKAGRQPQAAVLLRKLLEAEPDNLRVQTRLAELHLSMGQQKEAIETFHGAMQRVLDQGDHAEAIRLADRILQIDPATPADVSVEGARAVRRQARAPKPRVCWNPCRTRMRAAKSTTMLLDQYLESGQAEKAAALAEKVFARDPKNYAVAHRVAARSARSRRPGPRAKLCWRSSATP